MEIAALILSTIAIIISIWVIIDLYSTKKSTHRIEFRTPEEALEAAKKKAERDKRNSEIPENHPSNWE